MQKLYSTSEIAAMVGVGTKWVQFLGSEMVRAGVAQIVGKTIVCDKKAADYIKNRPDKRGRPKKITGA